MIVNQEYKKQKYNIPVFQAGGAAFTNQPAGDGIEVVSNSASDTGVLLTLWGTTNGSSHIVCETVTLDGTNQVATTKTDWGNLLGAFLGDIYGRKSNVAVGTITIREASANQTITTIAATKRSIGTQIFKIPGLNTTIHNISGNSYLNTREYPTINNAFQLTAGMVMDEKIPAESYLYLLGDTTGSTAQVTAWED